MDKAPTEAPPDTPSTYGSASGLRKSACIRQPANASADPVIKAAKALSSRKPSTVDASESEWPASRLANARDSSGALKPTEPVMQETRRLATDSKTSASSHTALRLLVNKADWLKRFCSGTVCKPSERVMKILFYIFTFTPTYAPRSGWLYPYTVS